MNEQLEHPAGRRRPVPADAFGGRFADAFLLDLEVLSVADLGPHLRSITFTSPDLVGFTSRPGQDVMFEVPGDEHPVRRRYSIRHQDPAGGTLEIWAVLHGDGPFARWAATAALGDHLDGIGPRGAVGLVETAAHHLFLADESAVAATFSLVEALPADASADVLVGTGDGRALALDLLAGPGVAVTWAYVDELLDEVRSLDLPPGTAAYLNGERSLVVGARDLLVRRGVPAEAIATKAYWRRGQANAPHGEPARD